MYNNKRILGIIPARSGSKGLLDKNIMELQGKPMMAYTIEAALETKVIDDVIVSTESARYAEIAKKYGAFVPFLRPESLAQDDSSTMDLLIYTINCLAELGMIYDYFIILQPTSPLRRAEDIVNSIELCFEKDADAVVSVCKAEHSPLWCNTLKEDLCLANFLSENTNKRRQDLGQYYRLNGAIYLSKVDTFLKRRTFYTERSYAYIMDKAFSVDIDDIMDFKFAEILINEQKNTYINQ